MQSWMRPLLPLFGLLSASLLLSCNVELGIDDPENPLFACVDDSDCGPGFLCVDLSTGGSACSPEDEVILCGDSVCGATEDCCDGACVDLFANVAHCGTCNNACPSGQVCDGGTCDIATCSSVSDCASDEGCCSGVCVDIRSDAGHCGRCDNVCTGGAACIGGACDTSNLCNPTCDGGDTCCDNGCVNTDTNPDHCGACGTVCDRSAGERCIAGTCEVECESNTDCTGANDICCGNECFDGQNSNTHCGSCDNACDTNSDLLCSAGNCESNLNACTDVTPAFLDCDDPGRRV